MTTLLPECSSFFRLSSIGTRLRTSQSLPANTFLPEPKPSQEGVSVVSHPASLRQSLQLLGVPSAENDVVEEERGYESLRDRLDAPLPFLPAQPLDPADPKIFLEGPLPEPEMAEFHGHDGAVDNQGNPEPVAERLRSLAGDRGVPAADDPMSGALPQQSPDVAAAADGAT